MSKKKIDPNGFVTYADCKFFCECVADYLGREIDPEGAFGIDPNGIYKVYRPLSEISKKEFVESLNAKPLLDDHTVIGNEDGMKSPDDENIGGVLTNVKLVGNELRGQIDIWSPSIIRKIRDGKRELSLSYSCGFKRQSGVFNGKRYEFVQSGLKCGNHLALVDAARNGHDCRVADGTFARDEKIKLEKPDMDISKLSADEVVEALKGCSDEVRAKCKDFLNTPTEDEKKAAEEKAKADAEAAAKKQAEEEAAKKAAEDEAAKKAEEDKAKAEKEKADACKDAVEEYKKAESLASDCAAVFGKLSMDGISCENDLVKHICGLKDLAGKAKVAQGIVKDSKPESAIAALRGYLAGCEDGIKEAKVVSDAKAKKIPFADYMAKL